MMAYTGPAPTTPSADTPPESPIWVNWWQYQTVLTNGRYEDEREAARVLAAARAVITDKQHAERMAAQAACAAAQTRAAEAQEALVAAMADTPRSKADVVLDIALRLPQVTGLTELNSIDLAESVYAAWKKRYP